MDNRVVWVDIAKGIGILSVIYAHIFSFGRSCIYLFHMPLFFFLSGIFFTPVSIRKIIIKKFQTLILPYFFFAAIFIPFKYCWLYMSGQPLPPFSIHCLSRSFFDVPLWFLFVLFGVTVLYGLLAMIRFKSLFVVISVVLSIIGWYSAAFYLHLPDLLVKTLLALPFFALGHAYSKTNCLQREKHKMLIILNVGGGTALLLIVISLLFDVKTDISICQIDKNLVLYMLPALLGIVSVILFSKVIAKNGNMANTVLSYLGKNSLYIFACHWPFIIPLTMLLDKWSLPHTLSGIIIMSLSIFFSLIIGHYLKPMFR